MTDTRRDHTAHVQRLRRAGKRRIDYSPSTSALAIIEARKAAERPNSVAATNSAALDAIVIEWSALNALGYTRNLSRALTETHRLGEEAGSKSHEFQAISGISEQYAHAHGRAYDFGKLAPASSLFKPARPKSTERIICGARRCRDGQPCQAKSELGKRRCRFHGGRSTGPKTKEGIARALANLRRGKSSGSP